MKKILFLVLALMSIPAMSSAITLDLTQAFSFQEDGTAASKNVDSTSFLKNANGVYGTGGTLPSLFFANGTSTSWYDAVALDFDLSPLGGDSISSANLMLKAEKGAYSPTTGNGPEWEHYLVLAGLYNPDHEDANPIAPANAFPVAPAFDFNPGGILSPGDSISNSVDGWFRIALNPTLLGANGELTLRLWNVSLDAVRLEVNSVPEPGSLLLLGTGLLGLAALRRKKRQ